MAQMGSYVPADQVELGVIDRIFTRIGASDNLVAGQSTFMLEMIDAANLVNNSTDRSLVIADELGRGTSTYDGLAIAWSITEYLHNKEGSPKTLIATHYHQLSELESVLDAVKNYQFLIRFEDENPVFDHKLARGSSDKSFGVEVAKLSGLPREVIDRGRLILGILENKATEVDPSAAKAQKLASLIMDEDGQSSLANWFEGHIQKISERNPATSHVNKPDKSKMILERLADIKVEELTPVASLNILSELVELIENKED
jgi:DNA mismatch repair protein MutS